MLEAHPSQDKERVSTSILEKGIDKVHMKRIVMMAIIKMCGKAILITLVAGTVIAAIGITNKWDSSLTYSNAFFIAGCLAIIAGTSSRLGAGDDWYTFQLLSAESFRGMSSGERAEFIVNASSSISFVILGLLSGIFLIIISVLVMKIF